MPASEAVKLIVQADDFGMCHAVNQGVVKAFTDGIVTQASMMAACPWFAEAAELAAHHGIPVGVHETLTSEWDYLRWSPLTAGASLRRSDNTFHRTSRRAREQISDDDAIDELCAQTDRVIGAGLTVTYLDVHMAMTKPVAYEAIAAKYGVPFLYPGISASLTFTSINYLSERLSEEKRDWFLARLERIATTPGTHLVQTHPAVDNEELHSMCKPDFYDVKWAAYYRLADIAVLCDPAIRQRIDELGIELTCVRDAFA